MVFLIFAIFSFIWYYPAYRKQGSVGRLPGRVYVKTILLGMFPATILLLTGEALLTLLRQKMTLGTIAFNLWESFISAALVEEAVKFLFARRVIRREKPARKIDYALLFGAVGLGYQISESLMAMDGLASAFVRGIFAYHILWQFWMGLFYYDYRQAKERGNEKAARKSLLLSLTVPFVLHGLNDFLAFMIESAIESGSEEAEAAWFLAMLVYILFSAFYLVFTMRRVSRAAKESRELTEEDIAPEAGAVSEAEDAADAEDSPSEE